MRIACLVVGITLALTFALPPTAENPGDLTGIYEGELHFPSHVVPITATLVQTPDQVAGLWATVFESGSGTSMGASSPDRPWAIREGPYTITNCRGTTVPRSREVA